MEKQTHGYSIEQHINLLKSLEGIQVGELDPTEVTQIVRGRLFFYLDFLLSKNELLVVESDPEDFTNLNAFLQDYLEFTVSYLKDFPNYIEYYNQGESNPELFLTDPNVAWAQCMREIILSLISLFGGESRCIQLLRYLNRLDPPKLLFETQKNYAKISEEDKEGDANHDGWNCEGDGDADKQNDAQNSIVVETQNNGAEKIPLAERQFINKFGGSGGFESLLAIIRPKSRLDVLTPEKSEDFNNSKVKEVLSNGSKAPAVKDVSIDLLYEITVLFDRICSDLDPQFLEEYVPNFMSAFLARIDSITLKEMKDIDLETVKKCFTNLERLYKDPKYADEISLAIEQRELDLYLKALRCPNFEKKLKSLTGIKEMCNRIDTRNNSWTDYLGASRQSKTLDSTALVDWILKNQILEDIYHKYNNPELIKRSLELLRFIAANRKPFPEHVIDLIWGSTRDNHEEVLRTVNENILELMRSLELDAIDHFSRRIFALKPEEFDSDLIKFVCDFTERGLDKIVEYKSDQYLVLKEIDPSLDIQHPRLGIPLLFSILDDKSFADRETTDKILNSFKGMANKNYCIQLWKPYLTTCLENLRDKKSIVQSYEMIQILVEALEKKTAEEYYSNALPLFEKQYHIVKNIVEEMVMFHENTKQLLGTYKDQHIIDEVQTFQIEEKVYMGKYSLGKNLRKRKEMLLFVLGNRFMEASLDESQLDYLWKIYVSEPCLELETREFFTFLTHWDPNTKNKLPLSDGLISYCFAKIISDPQKFDTSKFTREKFQCMKLFFILHNVSRERFAVDTRGFLSDNYESFAVISDTIDKLDVLWDYYYTCSNEAVLDEFTNLLVSCYLRSNLDNRLKRREKLSRLIEFCVEHILQACQQRKESGIKRTFLFLLNLFNAFDDKPKYLTASKNQKFSYIITLVPYDLSFKQDLATNLNLYTVKELIADRLQMDSDDLLLRIDDEQIEQRFMMYELKDFHTKGSITVGFKNRTEEEKLDNPKFMLTQNFDWMDKILASLSEIYTDNLLDEINMLLRLPRNETYIQKMQSSEVTEFFDIRAYSEGKNYVRLLYIIRIAMDLSVEDPNTWKWTTAIDEKKKSKWYETTNILLTNLLNTNRLEAFVSSGNAHLMIDIFTKTDIADINSFLKLKVSNQILSLTQLFLR